MAAGAVVLADLPGLLVAGLGEYAREIVRKGLLDRLVEVEMPDPVQYPVQADYHRPLLPRLDAPLGRPEPVVDLVEGVVPA